ncbi:MAG: hypothetical protein H0W74_06530 [Sphingosinicella sp.]|nr:hypothetical protein [Sphingosinicella sp.]
MTTPSTDRATKAGGFLLAASILIGTLAGAFVRQTSIGFLVGVGVGIALTLLIWLSDRRR